MDRLTWFMILYLIPALFVLICDGSSVILEEQDDESEMDQGGSSGEGVGEQMGNRAEESISGNGIDSKMKISTVQVITTVSSVILGMGTLKLVVLGL
ncbi:hypothetical protein XENTR_v10019683 [Xenopus tropicalis]|nr:hypothetical protein XENTR_v10019683 [Xenopus tropicalis]